MLTVNIPGFGALALEHLVLDFNGTLAVDGRLLTGVRPRLRTIAQGLTVHVLTADTFGRARRELARIPCNLVILAEQRQAARKSDYVVALGARRTACIGNGRNDRDMLCSARLGIAVVQAEGASAETLRTADVVASSVLDALDLLLEPRRLLATLRS